MLLTHEEQRMLDGEHGHIIQKCMQVLVTLGDIYGAERMVEVNNVHTPGVSYRVAGDAGLSYVKEASQSARFTTLTTLNTIGLDEHDAEALGFPLSFIEKQTDLSDAYVRMGAVRINTCTPYLNGSLPTLGEHIAWGESSAVAFANSVLGARTNREGGPTALAAAVTGRIPEYGFHLDENRRGKYLFRVEKALVTARDYAALGYFVGKIAGKHVPVLEGLQFRPSLETPTTLGAAMASSGAVALYHAVGYTPEAPSRAAVIGDAEPILFGEKEYAAVCEKFRYTGTIDFVVLGCPHASLGEMREVATLLKGKRVKSELWVCTSRQIKWMSDIAGYSAVIEKAGGTIVCDTCPVLCCTLERGHRSVATNSGKMAHYAPGHWGLQPALLTTIGCIRAAVEGKWGGDD